VFKQAAFLAAKKIKSNMHRWFKMDMV